jgi:hypothetical protein
MTGYNTTIFWNLIVQLLLCLFWGRWCNKLYHKKKAAPVHEAPALRGVRRRVEPLGVFVRSLSLQFLQEAVPVPVQKPFLWTSYIIAREKKRHVVMDCLWIPPWVPVQKPPARRMQTSCYWGCVLRRNTYNLKTWGTIKANVKPLRSSKHRIRHMKIFLQQVNKVLTVQASNISACGM